MKEINNKTSISIIIPVYNRSSSLITNLTILQNILMELDLIDNIPIILSDDGSNLKEIETIEKYIEESKLNCKFYKHENYGLQENELFLVSKVKTKYAMLVGDDDFLNLDYITKVLFYINRYDVGAIYSNFFVIDRDGNKTNRACRNRLSKDRIYKNANFKLIFLAHQMSGLVFKVEGILEYFNNVSPNLYPQISFMAASAPLGINIHITDCPFACTVLKQKQFNYSIDGLLEDILKNVYAIKINKVERKKLVNYFLIYKSNHFCNANSWIHPYLFLKKVNTYAVVSNNDKYKIILAFLVSYILLPIKLIYRCIFINLLGIYEKKLLLKKGYYKT